MSPKSSKQAKMGLPEVSLGLIPGYGGTQRLPKLIGKAKALEMILTAQMIDAERAYDLGLVNHVVSHESLMEFCINLANSIAINSSEAIARAITSVNASDAPLVNGYGVEIENFGLCFETEDFIEGIEAFLEKRNPDFQ
jgi:enoyl-CoA hydratase